MSKPNARQAVGANFSRHVGPHGQPLTNAGDYSIGKEASTNYSDTNNKLKTWLKERENSLPTVWRKRRK